MAHMEHAGTASARESVAPRVKKRATWFARTETLAALALALLVLGAWELAARAGWLSSLLFPAPSAISALLARMWETGELQTNLAMTLFRMLVGLALGGGAGLALGLVMGWSRSTRDFLNPIISATNPIPKVAILPLLMVIFGIGEMSKVIAIALAAFFPMLINTIAGVREISPIHFEVAAGFGAQSRQMFTRVLFPGSLPFIVAGARVALNVALVTTIAVELVSANLGLGAQMLLSWETLRTELLYAALFMVAVVGIVLNLLLDMAAKRLVPWQREH